MADIVGSLFGISTDQLQRQRMAEEDTQARAFAGMDRNQQAQYAGYKIGGALGRGVGQLLGLQDPELARTAALEKALNETQREVTSGDPLETYQVLAKKLADAGLNKEALQAQQEVYKLSQEQQKLQVDMFKATSEKNPEIVKLYRARQQAEAMGDVGLVKAIDDQIAKNTNIPEKSMTADVESERIIFDRYVKDLGREAGAKAFQAWQLANKKDVAKAGVAVPANGSSTVDVARLDDSFKSMVKPYNEKLSAINSALRLAQIAKTNPQAGVQLNTLLASLYQDGRVSNQDIQNVASAGSLPQRVVNNFNRIISGVDTETSIEDKVVLLQELQKAAAASNNSAVDRFENVWGTSGAGSETIQGFTKGARWKAKTQAPKTAEEYLKSLGQ